MSPIATQFEAASLLLIVGCLQGEQVRNSKLMQLRIDVDTFMMIAEFDFLTKWKQLNET
jgi:hypothetical protein